MKSEQKNNHQTGKQKGKSKCHNFTFLTEKTLSKLRFDSDLNESVRVRIKAKVSLILTLNPFPKFV